MTQDWLIRPARASDRPRLSRFRCASHARPWEAEVEEFVRAHVLDWALDPLAQDNDPRLLLLFDRRLKKLVGAAAHERTTLGAPNIPAFAATKLQVVAVAASWQGRTFPGGQRASDVLMSAALTDVAQRVPPRDARVFAVVHNQNARSVALCHRFGLIHDMASEDPAYRALVTDHKP